MQHPPSKVPCPPMLARRLRIVVRDREVANIFDYVPRTSAGVVMLTNAAGSAQCMTTSRADNDAADRKCGDQALGVERRIRCFVSNRELHCLSVPPWGWAPRARPQWRPTWPPCRAKRRRRYAVRARRSRLCRRDVQEHQRHAARPDGSRIQRPHHAGGERHRDRRLQGSGRLHQRHFVLRRHLERHLVEATTIRASAAGRSSTGGSA